MAIAIETDALFADDMYVPATYTPSGGEGFEIQAIIIHGDHGMPDFITGNGGVHILPVARDHRSDFRSNISRQVATVLVKAEDVATPGYRDTIQIDGVTWTVKEVYDHV